MPATEALPIQSQKKYGPYDHGEPKLAAAAGSSDAMMDQAVNAALAQPVQTPPVAKATDHAKAAVNTEVASRQDFTSGNASTVSATPEKAAALKIAHAHRPLRRP
jgi:hypothetical protein